MGLLSLPGELLLKIMESLRDAQDFQSLRTAACTCKALNEIAEIYIYSVAEFFTLSPLHRFLDSTSKRPNRKRYLRDLSLLFSSPRYDCFEFSSTPALTSFPNLASFVSESPECQPHSVKGTSWKLFMDSYMRAFTQASLLREPLETPRPLRSLRSLTLHWTGVNERYWDVTPACPIFLLPELESLEISCARVGQGESSEWAVEQLQRYRRKTRLRSLVLTECVVSVEALHLILSFPSALQRLDLCERYYHHRESGSRFAVNDTDAFNRAIAQQSKSLQHLRIFCHEQFTKCEDVLALSLSKFPVLSDLQLGPFPYVRNDRPHASNLILDRPVPPALNSLVLLEYEYLNFRDSRIDMFFLDLSVEDLVKNAEARGAPFTLDVSLRNVSDFPARFNYRRLRPTVRRLVVNFGEKFQGLQGLQGTSARSVEPSSESSPDNPNQASSRLRFLTDKPQHKIPPFLHDEEPPRFVVRYDSWHPEKVLSDPYTYG
ncbi:hypothetical protein F4818DRAFT_227889 [Hypoxylon cercidicola]|nr:hypothetical protein F4818DRAFT_227889 [Hypoxylon cercidicola]